MTILLVSQHYHPEPNFVTSDLAAGLAQSGEKVTVVTAHPNYPLGRFYDSVDSIWPRCESNGSLQIWRLPIYPNHSRSKLKRLFHYMSFTIMASLFAPFVTLKPSVIVVYQTPFSTGIAVLFFKYLYRAKVIFICADLWPESFAASGIKVPKLLESLLYGYSRWINRRADKLICTTKGIYRRYEADGIGAEKLVYAPLWVDGSGGTVMRTAEQKPFKCVYVGNLGAAQNVETIIRAAAILESRGLECSFEIYGSGTEEENLRKLSTYLKLLSLKFFGRVTPQEAFAISSQASVQLIHLVPSPLFAMTVPSKLAFSLSAGSPIVAGVIGESADLLHESGSAIVVPPNDPESFADAIEAFFAMTSNNRLLYGDRALAFYKTHFDKNMLLKRYMDIIQL